MPARLVFAAALLPAVLAVSCMDQSGDPVDWFVAIKQPDGYTYTYADANSQTLETSSYTLADNGGAIYATLTQDGVFSDTYALYNDEPPNKSPYSADGHTKGVFSATGDSSAFWLVHSVPKFPVLSSSNEYTGFPATETDYGQSFLCISLTDPESIDSLGYAFALTRPEFYETAVTTAAHEAFPALANVIAAGTHVTQAALNVTGIESAAGKPFTVFAKNVAWGLDLYNGAVSPYYKATTYAETWMNGINPCTAYCPPQYEYTTRNIQSYTVAGFTMGETKDHSKWCVVADSDVVCIGGINRQQSQAHRGGGTVCFESSSLSSQLQSNMVLYTDGTKGGCTNENPLLRGTTA